MFRISEVFYTITDHIALQALGIRLRIWPRPILLVAKHNATFFIPSLAANPLSV